MFPVKGSAGSAPVYLYISPTSFVFKSKRKTILVFRAVLSFCDALGSRIFDVRQAVYKQGCGSGTGSGNDPHSLDLLDPDLYSVYGSGSVFRIRIRIQIRRYKGNDSNYRFPNIEHHFQSSGTSSTSLKLKEQSHQFRNFITDPNLRIRTAGFRVRTLLFYSVTFKMPTK